MFQLFLAAQSWAAPVSVPLELPAPADHVQLTPGTDGPVVWMSGPEGTWRVAPSGSTKVDNASGSLHAIDLDADGQAEVLRCSGFGVDLLGSKSRSLSEVSCRDLVPYDAGGYTGLAVATHYGLHAVRPTTKGIVRALFPGTEGQNVAAVAAEGGEVLYQVGDATFRATPRGPVSAQAIQPQTKRPVELAATLGLPWEPASVAAADYNGDGCADLLVSARAQPEAAWLLGECGIAATDLPQPPSMIALDGSRETTVTVLLGQRLAAEVVSSRHFDETFRLTSDTAGVSMEGSTLIADTTKLGVGRHVVTLQSRMSLLPRPMRVALDVTQPGVTTVDAGDDMLLIQPQD